MSDSKNSKNIKVEYLHEDSSAYDIIKNRNLAGYCAVITGANRGLGLEIAKALAFSGCYCILACRNVNSARSVVDSINLERVYILNLFFLLIISLIIFNGNFF
jgi:NAD(P)-dependent dehydrogenase (short-subunit alcohol dehydrogenase family)